jgi:hypothetical protein
MKFYFLHIKSDEVGTTLKHPETINDNVKNLSNRIKTLLFYGETMVYYRVVEEQLQRKTGKTLTLRLCKEGVLHQNKTYYKISNLPSARVLVIMWTICEPKEI